MLTPESKPLSTPQLLDFLRENEGRQIDVLDSLKKEFYMTLVSYKESNANEDSPGDVPENPDEVIDHTSVYGEDEDDTNSFLQRFEGEEWVILSVL